MIERQCCELTLAEQTDILSISRSSLYYKSREPSQREVDLIFNSDQGSHFTSPQYVRRLLDKNVRVSMDGRGRALDNIFTERLWRTVKYEEVYLKDYATPKEARQELTQYLSFYNERRIHQSLSYRTPAAVYFEKDQNHQKEGIESTLKIFDSES